MSASRIKWQIASGTDTGVKRRGRPNEDAIGVYQSRFDPRPPLIVVADGMGGYQGGALASQTVVATFQHEYRKAPPGVAITDLLNHLVQTAHTALVHRAQQNMELERMGSTVVSAVLGPDRIGLVNVGDSRAYILHQGQLRQLTTDQSRRAELQQTGLSEAELRDHPQRSFLTMSLSPQRQTVRPLLYEESATEGDTVLLCSDGLWNTLSPGEITAILSDLDPHPAVQKLIETANNSQAADNVSAVVARLGARSSKLGDDS